jgi:hypothetical protein
VKSLACTGKRALPPFGIHMTMNTDAAPRTPLPTRRRLAAIRCAAFTPTLLLSCAPIVHADAVTDWNAIMETTVLTTDPAARIRTAAIVQVAVFEAVNSIVGDYEPYRNRIEGASGASPDAAAIAAAHAVLVKLHAEQAPQLDAAREESLAAITEGPGKADGVAVGIAAAETILALRARDGFDVQVPYTPGTEPGDYQPTPPDFTPAFMPGLGQVDTFSIRNGRKFRSAPAPAVRSKKYARDYDEVKRLGEAHSTERSEDRTRVARFYEVTEPNGVYYPAARQVSAAQGKTLSENARIFALLAMSIWDSAVACFETKYHFNVWRPVTAIRAGQTDGNDRTEPDPKWQPLVFTPPFPAYPSGHASFGGAARTILEREFGVDGHAITLTNEAAPGIVLRYTTFKQITDDIDDARIYGGVHYRFDQEAGALLGKRVGDHILRHELRSARSRNSKRHRDQ